MKISIIATLVNDDIVRDSENNILFLARKDLEFYKEKTHKKHVLFGRHSANSSYRDLGNRTNMVVSTKEGYDPFGGLVFNSIPSAIEYVSERKVDELFIAGGLSLFNQVLSITDRLYLIRYEEPTIFDGDRFPTINYDEWDIIEEESRYDRKIDSDVTFTLYERKS